MSLRSTSRLPPSPAWKSVNSTSTDLLLPWLEFFDRSPLHHHESRSSSVGQSIQSNHLSSLMNGFKKQIGSSMSLILHLNQVGPEEERAEYCLTSTIMLSLTTDNETSGKFSLSGSIRRQMKMKLAVAEGHLCNMGRMIEELEGKLRNSLDQVLPLIPARIPQSLSTCEPQWLLQ